MLDIQDVEGEDGLPCRHPDIDWLGKAGTCPECGMLLMPLDDSDKLSSGSHYEPLPVHKEDEPDVEV